MLEPSFDGQVSNENKFPGIELFIFDPLVTLYSRGKLQPIWNSSENLIATAGKALLLSISEKLARYLPHGHSKLTRSIAKSFSMLEHRVDARHGKFEMNGSQIQWEISGLQMDVVTCTANMCLLW